MAIEGLNPVREIPMANAVPQLSLTRGEEELQMEEGQPPMEVAAADQSAVCWRKEEDLPGKWKRRALRSRQKSLAEKPEEMDGKAEAALELESSLETSAEEEEAGMQMDIRS